MDRRKEPRLEWECASRIEVGVSSHTRAARQRAEHTHVPAFVTYPNDHAAHLHIQTHAERVEKQRFSTRSISKPSETKSSSRSPRIANWCVPPDRASDCTPIPCTNGRIPRCGTGDSRVYAIALPIDKFCCFKIQKVETVATARKDAAHCLSSSSCRSACSAPLRRIS